MYVCIYLLLIGLSALYLDRSDNPNIVAYHDWKVAPDYPGKSVEDLENSTVRNFEEIRSILESGDEEEEELMY